MKHTSIKINKIGFMQTLVVFNVKSLMSDRWRLMKKIGTNFVGEELLELVFQSQKNVIAHCFTGFSL
jgi:hypothetical protein